MIDIAGFEDTFGPFFDVLNGFVLKYLFEHASKVKFLCTITFDQIDQNRGKAIRDLFIQL